ncbi:glycosyltransferase [Halococcoides cellulosivorans]|uniref:Glycosyl transferase family 2 n=1 Tax=Halococcoides cellulosivorans TaxID=1679096 RepID=A0A2R4WY06_9EURY|nr:glycosyltransferase [Halococcoides cellulosivorans]AWB26416.1 glycosyl transferase family 2 [Halococcoides cellulosivorans]
MQLLVGATVALLALAGAPYAIYLGLYAWIRPSGVPTEKVERTPSVSIVLPTYDESGIVAAKLDDLLALDYPMERVELVVVDSSTDETPEIVREYFADRDAPDLTLIEETERRGLAPALNDGYSAATGEVVVKTDCDSKLAPDALREATAALADPAVGAVTGTNVEVLGGSAVEAGYRGIQSHIQQLESHLDSTLIFHGPFSAFEADSIRPIDPNSLADDTELALKIRRGGDRVIFDPAVQYKEASHSGFVRRRQQKDRRGMGLIRLLVQHRDALGRYGAYGRVVLPFNWWFMIVSPWLLVVTMLAGTAAAVSVVGRGGLAVLLALAGFVAIGQRDWLGPVQPLYSLFDTQVSLMRASVKLLMGHGDGTWEVDTDLREDFE